MEQCERRRNREAPGNVKKGSFWSFRAADWWEFKLAPLTAFFWVAALARGPLLDSTLQALLLAAAVAVAAAFVSALNDATDLAVDAAAGKPNPMAGRTPATRAAVIAVPAAAGMLVAYLWRGDVPLLFAYLGSYAAFLLYSVPPVRLKQRGALGAAADAAGAHLFPTLTALLLGWKATGAAPDPTLLAAGGAWSFGYGLRGILWHQLADAEADRRAAVRTLVRAWGAPAAICLGKGVALPLELAGLAVLLWRMDAAVPVLFLALHLGLLSAAFRRSGVAPALVVPEPGRSIFLHDYYAFWLPAGIIVQAALRHPLDLLLLLLQLALFPGFARRAAGGIWRMLPRRTMVQPQ